MGYRIMYSPEDKGKYPMRIKKKSSSKWLAAVLAVLVISIGIGKPEFREKAIEWLLPGDPGATMAAFSTLLEEIRSGDGLQEAVTAFCREILNETKTPVHYT